MQINEQWRKIAVAISNNLLKYPIRRKLFTVSSLLMKMKRFIAECEIILFIL